GGGGGGGQAGERSRDFRPFPYRRPWGPHSRRRRHRAGRDPGRDRSRRNHGRARENPVAPARPAVRDHWTDGGAGPPARSARSGMIRYALAGNNGHAFDSWFQNSAAYDEQAKAGARRSPRLPLA